VRPVEAVGQVHVHGAERARVAAAALATEVRRIHERYLHEVVAAYGLCPHLRQEDDAFGAFCVVVDPELDLEVAHRAVIEAESSIVHVVFPRAHGPAAEFERFGSRLDDSLKGKTGERLVHATFHPLLAGGPEDAHRLIGLLRRAPDPFVQFVPSGLTKGGTTLATEPAHSNKSHSERTFERLMGAKLDEVLGKLEDIRTDRARAYEPFLAALGYAP
jgi:hypothetical protein